MTKAYDVKYVNSAMLRGSGRGFLEIEETVSEGQLADLRRFPFIKSLQVVREFER